jgi:hypothetical protein
LYLSCEDGLGDNLRPRLEKMGANVANVIALEGKVIPGKAETSPVSLLDDEVLRKAMFEVRPALIVIDPIQGFLGPGVNMNRTEEVRPRLAMLGKLAEEFKSAVILIRHLTKSGKDKASYRGMGSIDFTAAARSVIYIKEAVSWVRRETGWTLITHPPKSQKGVRNIPLPAEAVEVLKQLKARQTTEKGTHKPQHYWRPWNIPRLFRNYWETRQYRWYWIPIPMFCPD